MRRGKDASQHASGHFRFFDTFSIDKFFFYAKSGAFSGFSGKIVTDEAQRLGELGRYQILDTPPEQQFDMVVELARTLFDIPTAAITLLDADRQWTKASVGAIAKEMRRKVSFCTHTIEQSGAFVVSDASKDPRFAANPLVTEDGGIRFYAGVPLCTARGLPLGAVCVISDQPRPEFAPEDVRKLLMLADIAQGELELRQYARENTRVRAEMSIAFYRSQISMNYAALLGQLHEGALPVDRLALVTEAAWEHHRATSELLTTAIRQLRARLPLAEYHAIVSRLDGFSV